MSRPARGAWVEMRSERDVLPLHHPSRPARGAWVEMMRANDDNVGVQSRPARGAWVEIFPAEPAQNITEVAPRKGRVG